MFAGSSFAEHAFLEHDYEPLDNSAFEAFLAEIASPRCWILELSAFPLAVVGGVSSAFADSGFCQVGFAEPLDQAAGGETTLRFATHGYISHATDTPADTYHEPRIRALPVVDRQIAGRDGIGGLTTVNAEIRLVNRDGGLDTLQRDYALDGRRARILIGRETDALADFGVFFTGVLQYATTGEQEMTIRLSDGGATLRRRLVNEAVYAGTGALEGGDDLKGKNKPVALGDVPGNVAPPLVDSAKLIYQVHNGAINDVPAVYDRGILLTQGADYASEADMNATAPAAGLWRVYKAGGYFRLGSTPAGTVTADVEGDATGSYVTTAAEIVQRILSQRAGLNSSEIDPTSFGALTTAQPAAVGRWYGTGPVTCEAAIDDLLYGIGAFGGFSRHGAYTVGLVSDASGVTESATFTTADIISVTREPLPGPVEPIVWRVGVGWQRNYTVQNDLAAAVTAARKTFCAEALRNSTTEDTAVQSRHLLARELGPIDANFALEADADTERDRLFALWGVKRSILRVQLRNMSALVRDIGQVVRLEDYPRHGIAAGVSARVLGHRAEGSKVELRVLV